MTSPMLKEQEDVGTDAAARGEVTPEGLHILQHSLGVDQYGRGAQYRNSFVTGEDSTDFSPCMALVNLELMKDHGAQKMFGEMHAFTVTDAGKLYVARHSKPAPRLSTSQKRYEQYLDADSGMKFGEWLRCQKYRPA